jgi:Mn2+/Fe2+ NRAMP family transporter
MLFWSAVVNGILAPPLLVLVVLMSSDPALMGRHASSPLVRILGWCAFAVMSVAALAMLVTAILGTNHP